jgi:hypothetical protein
MAHRAAAGGGDREQPGEPPYSSVHRHVVHVDAALRQQLLDASRYESPQRGCQRTPGRDHLRPEPEPSNGRATDIGTGGSNSTHRPSLSASPTAYRRVGPMLALLDLDQELRRRLAFAFPRSGAELQILRELGKDTHVDAAGWRRSVSIPRAVIWVTPRPGRSSIAPSAPPGQGE